MNARFSTIAIAGAVAAAAIGAGQAVAHAAQDLPHFARPATVTFTAVNAPSTVDFRSSPNWNYAGSTGFLAGDQMGLVCWEYGGSAGPYANTLWYEAVDYTRGGSGWVNDHYLSTPGTAAAPQPQGNECSPSGYGNFPYHYPAGPTFTVVNTGSNGNTSGTFSNSPNPNDYNSTSGFYIEGDAVQLYCYEYGAAVGQYGNQLWYLAEDQAHGGTYGWINDHYLNTPGTAANPMPQTPSHC